MAIYRLLQNSNFAPEDAELMCISYERALANLNLIVPSDAVAQKLAKLVLNVAQSGEKDPKKIAVIAARLMNDNDEVQLAGLVLD